MTNARVLWLMLALIAAWVLVTYAAKPAHGLFRGLDQTIGREK